jgi:hypothetical protein
MLDLIMCISAFITGVGTGMLLWFLIRRNDEKQEEDDDYEPFDINSIFKKGYVIEYIRDIDTSPFNVEPSYWEIEDNKEGWIKCVSQENSGERNIARIEELVGKHKFNIKDKDVIIASCLFGSIEIKNLNKE